MQITEVVNPKYTKADNSQIDCTITCDYGVVEYTARADDVMPYGRQLFEDLLAGTYGAIKPYAAPA